VTQRDVSRKKPQPEGRCSLLAEFSVLDDPADS